MIANPLLSIIIPCYNEVKTIEAILKLVHSTQFKNKEIIVVNDCSTDGSTEKLMELEGSSIVSKVIHHKKNMGKY